MNRGPRQLVGSAIGLGLDQLFGEPPAAIHPVAAFGSTMGIVERTVFADDRAAGLRYTGTGVALGALAGIVAGSTAITVACCAAGRMLRDEARAIARLLDEQDLDGARAALPALVGRDPSALDESGISAAVVESVAENTVDAVVAPALWGATGGAIGAAAHRAINTMDAMVGDRSERYARFGWSSARLDDAAAYVPARVTAALVCAAHPHRARSVLATVRRDAASHPSPNAGVAEAAFAAALGVELGGPLRYGTRQEDRPRLGEGPRPSRSDIGRAVELAERVELVLGVTLATSGLLWAVRARRSRRLRRNAPAVAA